MNPILLVYIAGLLAMAIMFYLIDRRSHEQCRKTTGSTGMGRHIMHLTCCAVYAGSGVGIMELVDYARTHLRTYDTALGCASFLVLTALISFALGIWNATTDPRNAEPALEHYRTRGRDASGRRG